MPSIYDMGPPALLPHPKGRHTEGFFNAQKKSEGFGRVRTRDLGHNSPACYHCATEALYFIWKKNIERKFQAYMKGFYMTNYSHIVCRTTRILWLLSCIYIVLLF